MGREHFLVQLRKSRNNTVHTGNWVFLDHGAGRIQSKSWCWRVGKAHHEELRIDPDGGESPQWV
jgi:hypothetical protein